MSNVTKCEEECDKNEQEACWKEMNKNDKKPKETCVVPWYKRTDVDSKLLEEQGVCETCG